jgi:hypothetical protein
MRGKRRALLISGNASELAKQRMEKAGMTLYSGLRP